MDRKYTGIPYLLSTLVLLLPPAGSAAPSLQRQGQITELLRQDCGACHGMTLKGGLGPALTVKALADRPAALLQETISNGRPGTPMPPWRQFLSGDEIAWLVEQLQQGLDHE